MAGFFSTRKDSTKTTLGLREFLDQVQEEVLKLVWKQSLGKSSPAGYTTKNEAIKDIVKFSDAVSVLNRQKITKDILMKYMSWKGIKFSIRGTKVDWCRCILEFWEWDGPKEVQSLKFVEPVQKPPTPKPKIIIPSVSGVGACGKSVKTSIQDWLKPNNSSAAESEASKLKPKCPLDVPVAQDKTVQPKVVTEQQNAAVTINATELQKERGNETVTIKAVPEKKNTPDTALSQAFRSTASVVVASKSALPKASEKPQEVNLTTTLAVLPAKLPTTTLTGVSDAVVPLPVSILEVKETPRTCLSIATQTDPDEIQMEINYQKYITIRQKERQDGKDLATQFALWFYNRLNRQELSPDDFWPEANVRIEYNFDTGRTEVQEALHSNERGFQIIRSLTTLRRVLFNPSLNSVNGILNPHGLGQVLVCGSSFLPDNSQIGVFEHVFGIMRDPFTNNNYKIRFCIMRLREQKYIINEQPECLDSSLEGIIIEEDEFEEQDLQLD